MAREVANAAKATFHAIPEHSAPRSFQALVDSASPLSQSLDSRATRSQKHKVRTKVKAKSKHKDKTKTKHKHKDKHKEKKLKSKSGKTKLRVKTRSHSRAGSSGGEAIDSATSRSPPARQLSRRSSRRSPVQSSGVDVDAGTGSVLDLGDF